MSIEQPDSRDEDPSEETAADPPRVNLFTNSAMRLHLPRPLPPTPGKEPSLGQRMRRLVRRLLGRGG